MRCLGKYGAVVERDVKDLEKEYLCDVFARCELMALSFFQEEDVKNRF
jgi:hypothetical protein